MSESIPCNHCGRYYGHRPACPSIIYNSGMASKLRALEERKIQMSKEKTREIKVWVSKIDLSELEERGIAVVRTDKTKMSHHILGASLSVPEKTAVITESEFDEAWEDIYMNDEDSTLSEAIDSLKNRLFGSET